MPYSPANFATMHKRRQEEAEFDKAADFHFEWDSNCAHHCASCCPALAVIANNPSNTYPKGPLMGISDNYTACSFALGRDQYCTVDVRIEHDHGDVSNGVLTAVPVLPFDREVSWNEPIDPNPSLNTNFKELTIAQRPHCDHGCKIYADERTGERVLAHNSTYGCKK